MTTKEICKVHNRECTYFEIFVDDYVRRCPECLDDEYQKFLLSNDGD